MRSAQISGIKPEKELRSNIDSGRSRVSEVSRNHSGFVPRRWVRPFSATKFHEACTASLLNSGVTGFCFNSKLRKSREDLFFWSPPRSPRGDLRKN